MQKFKKHLSGLLLISIAVVGIIGSSSSEKAATASNYLLPNDFDPAKQVLLIEKAGNENQLKEMEVYMQQNYPYKYEFVLWDDLSTDKYEDKTIYHFLLRKTVVSKAHAPTFDYRFYDLVHNQNYAKSEAEDDTPEKPLEKIVKKIIKKYR